MPQSNHESVVNAALEKLEALKHATLYCLESGNQRKGRIYYVSDYAKKLLDALGARDGGPAMNHGQAFSALIDSIARDVRRL